MCSFLLVVIFMVFFLRSWKVDVVLDVFGFLGLFRGTRRF